MNSRNTFPCRKVRSTLWIFLTRNHPRTLRDTLADLGMAPGNNNHLRSKTTKGDMEKLFKWPPNLRTLAGTPLMATRVFRWGNIRVCVCVCLCVCVCVCEEKPKGNAEALLADAHGCKRLPHTASRVGRLVLRSLQKKVSTRCASKDTCVQKPRLPPLFPKRVCRP